MAAVEKLERFRSYNRWLQEKFGERVYKVIVDAGFTCPNRDGTVAVGGCAYCNNNSFRPPSAIKTDPIRDQVREGIEYIRKRFEANKFIIYYANGDVSARQPTRPLSCLPQPAPQRRELGNGKEGLFEHQDSR